MQVFITIWSDVIKHLDRNQNKTLWNYFSKEMGGFRVGGGGRMVTHERVGGVVGNVQGRIDQSECPCTRLAHMILQFMCNAYSHDLV